MSGSIPSSVTILGDFLTLGNFKSLWQQLISPNLSHSNAIFVKVSKSIIFLVKSFLGNFYGHLAIFSGHTDSKPCPYILNNENWLRSIGFYALDPLGPSCPKSGFQYLVIL